MRYVVHRINPDGSTVRLVGSNFMTINVARTRCLRYNNRAKQEGRLHRYRIVREEGADAHIWRERERERLANGTYKALPWANEPWAVGDCFEHFAHVCEQDQNRVAYTPDASYGEQDRKATLSPNSYLRRYYGHMLTSRDVENWTDAFNTSFTDVVLKFAATREEIVRVYRNGPPSCMSHGIAHYTTRPIHPVEIYAAGDLCVAYIEKLEKNSCGLSRITGRAICWPEKRVFGRIYGDAVRLRAVLTKEGYTTGAFYGAKLLRIRSKHDEPNHLIIPYLDQPNTFVFDNGEDLTIMEAPRSNGLPPNWYMGTTGGYSNR